jgi:hypothetical protein
LFEDLVWDELKSSIEGIVGGGDMLKLLPEELLVELPKTCLMCLGIILHSVCQESCLEILAQKAIRSKRGKG